MNAQLAEELVNELSSSIESLETQHGALLQFLKDKGVVTDEEFGAYLEKAGKASGVRWRAARVRLDHLLEAEKREAERAAEKEKGSTRKHPEEGENSENKEGAKLTALDEAAAQATEDQEQSDRNEQDDKKRPDAEKQESGEGAKPQQTR